MKVTYWKAECLDDHDCYSIRARTKKECTAERNAFRPERFGEPVKIEIEYNNAFELVQELTNEGSSRY